MIEQKQQLNQPFTEACPGQFCQLKTAIARALGKNPTCLLNTPACEDPHTQLTRYELQKECPFRVIVNAMEIN